MITYQINACLSNAMTVLRTPCGDQLANAFLKLRDSIILKFEPEIPKCHFARRNSRPQIYFFLFLKSTSEFLCHKCFSVTISHLSQNKRQDPSNKWKFNLFLCICMQSAKIQQIAKAVVFTRRQDCSRHLNSIIK